MKERDLICIDRAQDGRVNVFRTIVPGKPQTLCVRLRRGQQVVVEIELDETKAKKAKKEQGK